MIEMKTFCKLSIERSEPPAVQWVHFGIPTRQHSIRIIQQTFILVATCLSLALLIYVPYAYFLVYPYISVGADMNGELLQVAGMLFGNVGVILGIMTWMCSYNA